MEYSPFVDPRFMAADLRPQVLLRDTLGTYGVILSISATFLAVRFVGWTLRRRMSHRTQRRIELAMSACWVPLISIWALQGTMLLFHWWRAISEVGLPYGGYSFETPWLIACSHWLALFGLLVLHFLGSLFPVGAAREERLHLDGPGRFATAAIIASIGAMWFFVLLVSSMRGPTYKVMPGPASNTRMQLTGRPVTALARSTIEVQTPRDALTLFLTSGQGRARPPRS